MNEANFISMLYRSFNKFLLSMGPLVILMIRVYLFTIFFFSGLTKYDSFESTTMMLFTNMYHVPIIPPAIAAYMGTFTELFFPCLILIGFFTRFSALILAVFNFVALWSYDFLWTANGTIGLQQHFYWGLLFFVLLTYGASKYSIDYLIFKNENR